MRSLIKSSTEIEYGASNTAKVPIGSQPVAEQRISDLIDSGSPRRAGSARMPMVANNHFVVETNTFPGPVSLHTDRNARPERMLSVLAYLKQPTLGGHTLFPLMETSLIHSELHRHRASNVLKALPNATTDRLIVADVTAAAEMCMELREAQKLQTASPYFGLPPTPGAVAVWWHWKPSKVGLVPELHPSGWHGGCPVVGTKLLYRSFHHVPELRSCEHTQTTAGITLQPTKAGCEHAGTHQLHNKEL